MLLIWGLTPKDFWWHNAVQPNQRGMPGRSARKWGDDILEDVLGPDTLARNRHNQTLDTATHKYMDEEYLSVANWVSTGFH